MVYQKFFSKYILNIYSKYTIWILRFGNLICYIYIQLINFLTRLWTALITISLKDSQRDLKQARFEKGHAYNQLSMPGAVFSWINFRLSPKLCRWYTGFVVTQFFFYHRFFFTTIPTDAITHRTTNGKYI